MISFGIKSYKKIRLLLCGVTAIALEMMLSNFVNFTDGAMYSGACKRILNKNIFDGYSEFLSSYVGIEPISFIFLYMPCSVSGDFHAANLITTFILLFSIAYYFKSTNILILIFLSCINYYFLVIAFGAFRLKIAVAFIFFALGGKGNVAHIFNSLSIFSHFQSLLIIFPMYFKKLKFLFEKNIFKIIAIIILIIFSTLFIFDLFYFYILDKLDFYKVNANFSIKILLVYVFIVFAFGFKWESTALLFTLEFLSILVGDGRVVILFILYFYVLIGRSLGIKKITDRQRFALSVLTIYLAYKAYFFVDATLDNISYFEIDE